MKLSDYRRQHNITQYEFGRMIGVGLVTVSRWEVGTRMPSAKSQRLILTATDGAVAPNDWIIG